MSFKLASAPLSISSRTIASCPLHADAAYVVTRRAILSLVYIRASSQREKTKLIDIYLSCCQDLALARRSSGAIPVFSKPVSVGANLVPSLS